MTREPIEKLDRVCVHSIGSAYHGKTGTVRRDCSATHGYPSVEVEMDTYLGITVVFQDHELVKIRGTVGQA